MTGSDVNITVAENSRTDITTVETKSSGLTVSLGGAAGSLLDGMVQTAKSAKQEDDGQLELAQYLDAYGTQLQLRGMSEADALKVVEQILKYPSSAKPDLSAEYNKALGQLSTEERHAWQAAIGTDALLAGPGRISQLMRLALISSGSYQAGTGIGCSGLINLAT